MCIRVNTVLKRAIFFVVVVVSVRRWKKRMKVALRSGIVAGVAWKRIRCFVLVLVIVRGENYISETLLRGFNINKIFSLTLKIDSVPPPLNVVLRQHYHKRARHYTKIYNHVDFLCRGKVPPEPLGKAKIKIERHHYRFCDFDGVVAAYKPYVDSLIKTKVILNDNWKVLGAWEVNQIFRPKRLGPLSIIEVTGYEESESI